MRAAVWIALCLVGCSQEPEEANCEPVDTSCTPQYEPTFDNIYERTLVPSCATGGGSCHASADASGLSMADIDTAYDGLSVRVATTCDVLGERLTSDNPSFQMPPGKPLSDGEQCAIMQWIDAGAPR